MRSLGTATTGRYVAVVVAHRVLIVIAVATALSTGCTGKADVTSETPLGTATVPIVPTVDDATPVAPPQNTTAESTSGTAPTSIAAGTPPTSSSPLPSATTTTAVEFASAAGSGLFCGELAELGFDYRQAAEYWIREGTPDRMDADRDGIPCETVYEASDVMAYWNPAVVLEGSDVRPGDAFGYDVQLAGGRVVVPSQVGVYIFTPTGASEWIETKLEPAIGVEGELYPRGVAASGNGVAVGAVLPNVADADFLGPRGAVYMFTAEDGIWGEERIEIDLVSIDVDRFAVAAVDDDRVVVRSGRGDLIVLIRERNGWIQLRVPTDVLQDGCPECPVDIAGNTIALGHPWLGGVFVFNWNDAGWTEERLPALGCGSMDGSSLDIEGVRILVGADGHSPGPGGPACVYLQTRGGSGWVSEVIAEGGEGLGEDVRLSGGVVLATASSDILTYRKQQGTWTTISLEFDIERVSAVDADGQLMAVSNSGGLRESGSVWVFDMPIALRIDPREG